ncbi:MAG: hypothetical protein HY849_04440 [Nitrosomonadales bacterium]|nr:hypothetical protein [Nitrosomonadales bacterium]
MDHILFVLNKWGIELQLWINERTNLEIIAMLTGSVLAFPFLFFLLSWIMHIRITPIDEWLTRHLNALEGKLRKVKRGKKPRK